MKYFYTVSDLIEMLGHTEKTILKLIKIGEIKAFKSAGQWRVLKEELDAYRQRNTHNPKGYQMNKKVIIVNDCLQCPLVSDCKEIKNLTSVERVYMMTSNNMKNAILKTCPLEDYVQKKKGQISDEIN